MSKEKSLMVEKTVMESADAMTLYLQKPLFGKFKYQSGQFLTICVEIDGDKHQRAYSLSSSPDLDKSHYCITIKRVEGGLVSNYVLDNIKPGDFLDVYKPKGSFKIFAKNSSSRHVILMGGGSGITPLFSMAKTILTKEKQSHVSLVYANRGTDGIIFKEYLDFLAQEFGNRFKIVNWLSSDLDNEGKTRGRLVASKVPNILSFLDLKKPLKEEFYLCGPDGLMQEVEDGLALAGVAKEQVFKESFTKVKNKIIPEKQNLDFPQRTIKLILKRESHGLLVPANTTILDAALENKIKIPYACGSGTCATCMCKVKEGEVEMIGDHCLSAKDVKKGYVLTCMSYAKSDKVLLEAV